MELVKEDSKLPNLHALTGFRLKGKHVEKGQIVKKSDFAKKSEWLNLVNMRPARAEQTGEKVGPAPKPTKAPAAPTAGKD